VRTLRPQEEQQGQEAPGEVGRNWDWLANLDFNLIGYFIVGMFVVTWIVALAVWRFGRIEEKWTAHLQPSEPG
jgi:high-affinity nickel-transport protein